MRVDLAFQPFFRRVTRKRQLSWFVKVGMIYNLLQTGFSLENNILTLCKIERYKSQLHRPIEWNIKRLTIRRSTTQNWFVSISTDNDSYNPLEPSDKSIGIDVGILLFAALLMECLLKNLDSMLRNRKI